MMVALEAFFGNAWICFTCPEMELCWITPVCQKSENVFDFLSAYQSLASSQRLCPECVPSGPLQEFACEQK